MLAKARRDNMTMRDLYNLVAAARGHVIGRGQIVGTYQQPR